MRPNFSAATGGMFFLPGRNRGEIQRDVAKSRASFSTEGRWTAPTARLFLSAPVMPREKNLIVFPFFIFTHLKHDMCLKDYFFLIIQIYQNKISALNNHLLWGHLLVKA